MRTGLGLRHRWGELAAVLRQLLLQELDLALNAELDPPHRARCAENRWVERTHVWDRRVVRREHELKAQPRHHASDKQIAVSQPMGKTDTSACATEPVG